MVYLLLSFFACVLLVNSQEEGERCYRDNQQGVCMIITNCQAAQLEIQNRGKPQICSWGTGIPIVCCVEEKKPVATTPKIPSTTVYVPPIYDYKDTELGDEEGCEALDSDTTAEKTGQKAWDKCIEYQQKLVFPCEPTQTLAATGSLGRSNKCHHSVDELIVGGVDASEGEFPHMALLGYGPDEKSAEWVCAGSIVSERFILTAGHCTSSSRLGNVSYAKVGIQKRTDQVDRSRVYQIQSIIKHPDYKPPNRYSDIALLKTEREIKLNEFIVPACLDVRAPGKYDRALASGWGATQNRGSNADQLQKVILEEFTTAECAEMFPKHRLMKKGFDANTQICYGDKKRSADTCQGDSGGPLQIKSRQISCMYTVVGVTSFGRACGYIGEPGIYTRVTHYVPWIENIVWP